jgi:hypothetical protein
VRFFLQVVIEHEEIVEKFNEEEEEMEEFIESNEVKGPLHELTFWRGLQSVTSNN